MARPFQIWKRKDRGGQFFFRLRGEPAWRATGKTSRADALEAILGAIKEAEELKKAEPLKRPGGPSLGEYLQPFFVWERCPHVARLRGEGKRISKQHAKHQRSLIDRYILTDPLADKPVKAIRRGDVLDFRQRLIALAGPRTVNSAMTVLKSCIKEGIFREDLEKDPTIGVGNIRYEKRQSGIFSAAELLDLSPPTGPGPWEDLQGYCAFLVAATCGLRRGELLALRWKDIDFEELAVHVEQAWKDETEIGEPKWGQRRTVPLPTCTAAKLKELRADSIHVLPDSLVLCYEDGSRLGATWFTKRFARAMAVAGVDTQARGPRPHSFRHSLNTLLRDAGYSDEKIRAAMGWSNEGTQKLYTHWNVSHLRDQAKIIDGIWG